MFKVLHNNCYYILKQTPQRENLWWLYRAIKPSLLAFVFLFSLVSCSQKTHVNDFTFQAGDIILQALNSSQCQAIREATDNYYSHCGIVLEDKEELVVYEAVGPVRKSELKKFTMAGINGHFVVLRLLEGKAFNILSAHSYCNKELGKKYDWFFNWDDAEIYCSELVWKAYKAAGIEICAPRPLIDYNLSSANVQAVLKQRYGAKIPKEELMVAPSDLFSSPLLQIVYENKK
jgi:hypothetical protein